METLTSVERISRILKHEPVDRIGLYEHFWGDTRNKWTEDGFIQEDEDLTQHFGLDIRQSSPLNMVIDPDFERQLIEETEDTELFLDGNGAKLRWHKKHASTPEHVGFTITSKKEWDELAKPKLSAERRRIDFLSYREAKEHARRENRFFCWTGAHVFEIMKNVAGHEHMLVGMALEPDWIKDMVMTYSQMYVDLQEMLFAEEGYPDGIWYYEDMGFKQRPFMSPEMYLELVQPGHKLSFDFAHGCKLPVIIHSCGFVEALVPGLIDAGMDCLQVIEIKAGMDLLRLYQDFGEQISFMGGIDVRTLYSNDRDIILRELAGKIPTVMKRNGYVLHSDHSIPNTVNYDSYRYFIEEGLRLGSY